MTRRLNLRGLGAAARTVRCITWVVLYLPRLDRLPCLSYGFMHWLMRATEIGARMISRTFHNLDPRLFMDPWITLKVWAFGPIWVWRTPIISAGGNRNGHALSEVQRDIAYCQFQTEGRYGWTEGNKRASFVFLDDEWSNTYHSIYCANNFGVSAWIHFDPTERKTAFQIGLDWVERQKYDPDYREYDTVPGGWRHAW